MNTISARTRDGQEIPALPSVKVRTTTAITAWWSYGFTRTDKQIPAGTELDLWGTDLRRPHGPNIVVIDGEAWSIGNGYSVEII